MRVLTLFCWRADARPHPLWIPAFAGMTSAGGMRALIVFNMRTDALARPLWIPAFAGMTEASGNDGRWRE